MTKRITADLLRSKGACEEKVAIFEKRWPNGVVPTKRQVPVIVRLGLDVDWAATHLLEPLRRRMAHGGPMISSTERDCVTGWAWETP